MLNARKNIFLFDCFSYEENSLDSLLVLDLSTAEGKLVAEKNDYDGFCTSCDEVIFTFNDNKIKAYDINLKERNHPVVELFDKNKEHFKDIRRLVVNLKCKIVFFSDYKLDETWMISWSENNGKGKIQKLFNFASYGYKFTYDNKWFVFESFKTHPSQYMIMPCSEEHPNFFGKPILLGDVPEFPSGGGVTAVTRNPAGFVIPGTDDYGDSYWLKKWDFTKAEELIEKE